MTESFVPLLQRWALLAGVLLLVGVVAWRSFVAPRLAGLIDSPGDEPGAFDRLGLADLDRSSARVGLWTAVVLLPIWGLRLYTQLLAFRDPFAPLSEDLSLLVRETFWGTVWLAQGVVVLLLIVGFFFLSRRPPERSTIDGIGRISASWKAAGCGVALLVLTLSLSSHAMSVQYNRPLAVAVDATHLAAAGAWMGSLALILILHRSSERSAVLFAAQLRAFSPLAMVAVGVLVFMGVVLSGVHLMEIRNLWASPYGRILSAKILVAGGVMAMGLWNWRRGLPTLDTAAGRRSVRRRAGIEVGLAAGVLLLTAILVGTSMPEGTH